MENLPQYCVTRKAIESLTSKLKLTKLDEYSQDWEYEACDSTRVTEFVSFYENDQLNMEERFALMNLIISSYDDALVEGKVLSGIWDRISSHLMENVSMYIDVISYWAILDEDFEDGFAVTPYMRELLKTLEK